MAPGHDGKTADDKPPEGKAGGNPLGVGRHSFFKADALSDNVHKMMPCQPEKIEKKNAIGADHLGFFRPRQGRAESDAQGGCRNIITQNIQQSHQEPSRNEKKPEGKGNLLGGQKSKADKSRVDINFDFIKACKKSLASAHKEAAGNSMAVLKKGLGV